MAEQALSVAGRIGEALSKAGMSQRDLARYSGLSQPTISRILTGGREVSSIELALIADACGVRVADLEGRSTVEDTLRCAGRTDENAYQALSEYLTYAFSCSRRLSELGIPDPA